MQVTVVGSGGPAASKRRACPCFLIDRDVLVDCGAGAVRNLKTLDIDLTEIREILISHAHADHIGDLVSLLWAMRIDDRTKPLEITGPTGIESTALNLLSLMNTESGFLTYTITFKELEGGEDLGDIRTCRTNHKLPTVAYRIERGGRSICYSGDTSFCEDVITLARGCDLLIHEATFLEEQREFARQTTHSTAVDAGRAAQLAGAKKVIIFHIPPPNERMEDEYLRQVRRSYGGEVVIAEDGISLAV